LKLVGVGVGIDVAVAARALTLALAEMDVQGVSTRNVAAITEQVCGVELSSMQLSRAAAQLAMGLEQWRRRPSGRCVYLDLDARYEQVRVDGQVRDAAVLVAMGVQADGKRSIRGVLVSLSEQEAQGRQFLPRLLERGLSGVQVIISDAHAGVQAARRAMFGGVPRQRCQFHLHQNAQASVPRQELTAEVAAASRAIFTAPSRADADALLARTVQHDATTASKRATWLETALREGVTVVAVPTAHRQRLRTVNGRACRNQEIRWRTRVVGVFPNEASCLRLVSA
jgi:putative transposase